MIYIYYSYISKKNHSNLIETYLPRLKGPFQERILSFFRWEDMQLSLLGRLLLNKAIEIHFPKEVNLNKDIHFTAFGKPYFHDDKIKFNISHSGRMVICAVTDKIDIGIDIEEIKELAVGDFKSQMTPLEWSKIIQSKNIYNDFYVYWTQKEAVLKAIGDGLSIPLNSFEISNNLTLINGTGYKVIELNIDTSYKCHLAYRNEQIDQEIFIKSHKFHTEQS